MENNKVNCPTILLIPGVVNIYPNINIYPAVMFFTVWYFFYPVTYFSLKFHIDQFFFVSKNQFKIHIFCPIFIMLCYFQIIFAPKFWFWHNIFCDFLSVEKLFFGTLKIDPPFCWLSPYAPLQSVFPANARHFSQP